MNGYRRSREEIELHAFITQTLKQVSSQLQVPTTSPQKTEAPLGSLRLTGYTHPRDALEYSEERCGVGKNVITLLLILFIICSELKGMKNK
jgi:hypothetical protein